MADKKKYVSNIFLRSISYSKRIKIGDWRLGNVPCKSIKLIDMPASLQASGTPSKEELNRILLTNREKLSILAAASGVSSIFENPNRVAPINSSNKMDAIPCVPTSNCFSVLADASDCLEENSSAPLQNSSSAGKITDGRSNTDTDIPVAEPNRHSRQTSEKVPPIYASHFSCSASVFEKQLTDLCGKTFKLKLLKKGIRIQFDNLDSHKKMINFLKENNKNFFTFTRNSEKILSVVLRGLPATPTDAVLSEIKNHGLLPTSIFQIGKSISKPIFRVNFPAGTSLSQVNKIGFLFSTRVYWVRYYSNKNHTQCFRCQAFRHSASKCNMPPRCVKCGAKHRTADCSKTPDTPARCANCGGQHTDNYSGCPSLLDYLSRRDSKRSKPLPPPSAIDFPGLKNRQNLSSLASPPSRPARPSRPMGPLPFEEPMPRALSYADAAKHGPLPRIQSAPSDEGAKFNELMSEFQALHSLVDVDLMLSTVKTLNTRLRGCNSDAQKFQVFISVLGSLK
ncbi:uncharacterized protein LOC143265867 [Megachile rotundata]|uniref:uncharacterized protein LOC143265867 n=1 Tax=Megachile rotundata TaxID=143995 RepID=UPI003FD1300C